MTQEELKLYMALNESFIKECKRVAEILKEKDKEYKYVYFFYIEEKFPNLVTAQGSHYFMCDKEDVVKRFPIEFLTMTNEEINKQ